MGMENNRWRVVRGDCLWNIASSVYGNPYKWRDIAIANGISQTNHTIYPGQLLKLPGKTPGVSGTPNRVPSGATSKTTPRIEFFALRAGEQREMVAAYSFKRVHFDKYQVRWRYRDKQTGNRWITLSDTTTKDIVSFSGTAPQTATHIQIGVKPLSKNNSKGKPYWTDGKWAYKEWNFAHNPPEIPPKPAITLSNTNRLEVEFTNIQDTIHADSIEIVIYKNQSIKYRTGVVTINKTTNYAKYITDVDAGNTYMLKCRAVRDNKHYGGWTEFSDILTATPIAPNNIITLRSQKISEQLNTTYGVSIEWTKATTATHYEIQYTTNLEYFETGSSTGVTSIITEEESGCRYLVNDIELGHEYYFRVRSINEKGHSVNWTPVKSTKLGSKPSAPTTWSNVRSAVIGEDINFYWVHNSTDGSYETYARLSMTIMDHNNPGATPIYIDKTIKNTKPEENKNETSVYTINTTDPEWAVVRDGMTIKWQIQTTGVTSEYGDWSVEREINVYSKPEITVGLIDNEGNPITEVNRFPFYITISSLPYTQDPISYYIRVIANSAYTTMDDTGRIKEINVGDVVYQKYFDPKGDNIWTFLTEMTPGNINLESNVEYNIVCEVTMNSGLSAKATSTINVLIEDATFNTTADVTIDMQNLTASIHPYSEETILNPDDTTTTQLVENCLLSVYRIEYDGSFTEIIKDVPNEEQLFITDPHPTLDYARYRIVSKMKDTGAMSFGDITDTLVGKHAIVIQWEEDWIPYQVDEDNVGLEEPNWSGSMLILPYNIDVNEERTNSVSLVSYAGRKSPVSYYGEAVSDKATWKTVIPANDKDTLYAIRRLSNWAGDVYAREPSGMGYWASITVSYDLTHLQTTIPVTFSLTKVEGGI